MSYIFLDESGQFTKHDHEQYFVVGSFTIGEPRRTEKKFRSWCKTKFPKKMRLQNEIKFSQNNIDDKIRIRTIKHISNLDVRIRYCFLKRENIPDGYWKKKKLQSGILYTEVIGELLETYLPPSDKELRIFCDQRKLLGVTKKGFQDIISAKMLSKLPAKSICTVDMVDSAKEPNIQIADWITGSIARYLESKPLGDELFKILKNNFVGEGKELFKDNRKQTKKPK